MSYRLSVLVPCFNVERYVEHCLDAVLTQLVADVELIVVDDASTDSTWDVLQQYRANPRIRLFKMEKNCGIGLVRNFCLDHSLGEYFIFLDADDWLIQGAIGILLDSISNSNPDLVFFNFARIFQTGPTAIAAPYEQLFKRLEGMPDRDEKRLMLLDFPTMSWFKMYRKSFVLNTGIRFGDRIYEDVSWSHALTSLSNSTAVIPLVLYCYRQHGKSLMKGRSANHLALIDEYKKLFQIGQALADDRYMGAFGLKAAEHFELVLFGRSGNLTLDELREFFEHAFSYINILNERQRKTLIPPTLSWGQSMRRSAWISGKYPKYLVLFAIYRVLSILRRPFELVGIYFSKRRIDTSIPLKPHF